MTRPYRGSGLVVEPVVEFPPGLEERNEVHRYIDHLTNIIQRLVHLHKLQLLRIPVFPRVAYYKIHSGYQLHLMAEMFALLLQLYPVVQ